ncbi:hypothetical protein H7849_08255 [Alloacidobacterium dinghuense]|uniref:Uncharacterized protein n=1 Tax=Alloacidobacterium dinghuense TaxID=2763107 RepID=A0A7G8BMW6_9BACT|nr:DUF6526 family protein [Alloacidobacterium dinghuense]QNI33886.1 hypothetical protein H7849_08255 [Alloacidobacterium dinghuense]
MSENSVQSYTNYKRRHAPFHFFLIPILITNLILAIVYLVRHPDLAVAWMVLLSIAILVLAFLTRINPIKVQDRLIRLEERMRLAALLPEPLRLRIPELTEHQLVALRFASDAEIPRLVEETLRDNLKPMDIKKKIQNWRPDYFRV